MDQWLALLEQSERTLSISTAGFTNVQPHWQFKRRQITDHLLWVLTHGSCHGSVNDEALTLGPGDALWVGPDNIASFQLPEAAPNMRLYHIRFALDAPLPNLRRSWLKSRMDAHGMSACAALRAQSFKADTYARSIQRACLIHLCAQMLRDRGGEAAGGLSSQQQKQIEALCDSSTLVSLDSADLARCTGLSRDYFVRRFTQTYGYAPRRWLVRQRILRAAEELASQDLSITELAERHGFPDTPSFAKRFKKEMGMSPGRWRDKATI